MISYTEEQKYDAENRAKDILGNYGLKEVLTTAIKDHVNIGPESSVYNNWREVKVTAFRELDPENDEFACGFSHEIEVEYSHLGWRAIYGVAGFPYNGKPQLFAN